MLRITNIKAPFIYIRPFLTQSTILRSHVLSRNLHSLDKVDDYKLDRAVLDHFVRKCGIPSTKIKTDGSIWCITLNNHESSELYLSSHESLAPILGGPTFSTKLGESLSYSKRSIAYNEKKVHILFTTCSSLTRQALDYIKLLSNDVTNNRIMVILMKESLVNSRLMVSYELIITKKVYKECITQIKNFNLNSLELNFIDAWRDNKEKESKYRYVSNVVGRNIDQITVESTFIKTNRPLTVY